MGELTFKNHSINTLCEMKTEGELHPILKWPTILKLTSWGPWYNSVNFGAVIDSGLGGVPREQTMLEGHLSRVIYHQAY